MIRLSTGGWPFSTSTSSAKALHLVFNNELVTLRTGNQDSLACMVTVQPFLVDVLPTCTAGPCCMKPLSMCVASDRHEPRKAVVHSSWWCVRCCKRVRCLFSLVLDWLCWHILCFLLHVVSTSASDRLERLVLSAMTCNVLHVDVRPYSLNWQVLASVSWNPCHTYMFLYCSIVVKCGCKEFFLSVSRDPCHTWCISGHISAVIREACVILHLSICVVRQVTWLTWYGFMEFSVHFTKLLVCLWQYCKTCCRMCVSFIKSCVIIVAFLEVLQDKLHYYLSVHHQCFVLYCMRLYCYVYVQQNICIFSIFYFFVCTLNLWTGVDMISIACILADSVTACTDSNKIITQQISSVMLCRA